MIHEKRREEILGLLKDDSDYKRTMLRKGGKKEDFLVKKIKEVFNEKSVHVCKAKDDFYSAGNSLAANRMRYELHKMFM